MQGREFFITRFVCSTLLFTALSVGLTGCGSMRLYDASKAQSSAAIKQNYKDADPVGTVAVQKANLDALIAAELEVVRDNQQLQLDISLLQMADNDTPMFETWDEDVTVPLNGLGFKDGAAVRAFLNARDEVALRRDQLRGQQRRLVKRHGRKVAACETETKFSDAFKKLSRSHNRYAGTCAKWQTANTDVNAIGGNIGKARRELQAAEQALRAADKAAGDAKKAMAGIKQRHKQAVDAVKAAQGTPDAVRTAIATSAGTLSTELAGLAKTAPGVVAEERVEAVLTLLKATAGEETQVENDEALSKAVLVIGGVSSLAPELAGLVAEAQAPTVSNLLIELQHQVVLLEHAKALHGLEIRRRDIRKARLESYYAEADELLKFADGLCSFAFHTAGKGHPGVQCDSFTVDASAKSCRTATTEIADCALKEPWKKYLKSPPKGDAGREFYKALAAFTRIFPQRAARMEQNFNLIDLQHRENLIHRKMALKAWNNLAQVPIEQIAAYYEAGLKPAEIADLLVKALGFTAVTIGVAQ